MADDGGSGSASVFKEPWRTENEANKMFDGPDGSITKGRIVFLTNRLAQVYLLLAVQAEETLGVHEAHVRAWVQTCKWVAKEGKPKTGNLLAGIELETALDSLKSHVGTLEAEAGMNTHKAPPGPGEKAMSAIDSDPLRGLSSTILGKRGADQEIEASNAKVKTVIPRVLPTMAGVYTQSVARALFAPRASRFTPKSHAIERVSWGTIAVMKPWQGRQTNHTLCSTHNPSARHVPL
jgi:hypothetical protein